MGCRDSPSCENLIFFFYYSDFLKFIFLCVWLLVFFFFFFFFQFLNSCNLPVTFQCSGDAFSPPPPSTAPPLTPWSPGTLTGPCCDREPEEPGPPQSGLSLHGDPFTFPVAPHVLKAPAPWSPRPCATKKRPVFSSSVPPPLSSLSLSVSVPLSPSVPGSLGRRLSPPSSLGVSVSPPASLTALSSARVTVSASPSVFLSPFVCLCLSVSPSRSLRPFLSLFKFQSNPLNG